VRKVFYAALGGCDLELGQGFLFAPAMPQDRLIVLLRELAHKFAVA